MFSIPGSIFTQNIIFFLKLFTYVNANGRNEKFEEVNCNILGKVEITELMSGNIWGAAVLIELRDWSGPVATMEWRSCSKEWKSCRRWQCGLRMNGGVVDGSGTAAVWRRRSRGVARGVEKATRPAFLYYYSVSDSIYVSHDAFSFILFLLFCLAFSAVHHTSWERKKTLDHRGGWANIECTRVC